MPAPASSPTILVVDDDAGLLILIEGALRAEKWNVATAGSGADALAWLHQHSADLLLLDLKLHDIEGRKFIDVLADAGHTVPFVIITGQGDERVAVDMMKRGALDYLVKDVNFVEFVPTVVRRGLAQLERERRLAEAEQSLRDERNFVTAVLQTSGALVVVLDEAGRVVRFNRACEQVTGYAAGEVVGKSIWELLVPPEEMVAIQSVFERLLTDHVSNRFENRWLSKTGQRRLISWSNTVLTNSNGTVKHVIGTGLDITERKHLENQILELSEREQRKFGHDLHDGLGQRLTALEMFSHALAEDLERHAPALAKQARRLNQELRETVTQARLISHSLAPVPLEGDGLMHGLSELAASTSRIPGVKCLFRCDPPVSIQDAAASTHLYRIAQEAVNNALKHGLARKIVIALTESAKGVELSVENNGCPIPEPRPANGGMGLNVMRYRAGMIDANLSIESGKRKTVRVTCTLRKKA